jgi:hypothetical protein
MAIFLVVIARNWYNHYYYALFSAGLSLLDENYTLGHNPGVVVMAKRTRSRLERQRDAARSIPEQNGSQFYFTFKVSASESTHTRTHCFVRG